MGRINGLDPLSSGNATIKGDGFVMQVGPKGRGNLRMKSKTDLRPDEGVSEYMTRLGIPDRVISSMDTKLRWKVCEKVSGLL